MKRWKTPIALWLAAFVAACSHSDVPTEGGLAPTATPRVAATPTSTRPSGGHGGGGGGGNATPTPAPSPTAPQLAQLPPDPKQWSCDEPHFTAGELKAWCDAHPARGTPASLPPFATLQNLDARNNFDIALRDFLRSRQYVSLGWIGDQGWRLTGPLLGEIGKPGMESLGVHPAVRVFYSPEVVKYLCEGGTIPDGALIVKEMRRIDETLDIDPAADCMTIRAPSTLGPMFWAAMYRQEAISHDGWFWANPTGSGDGNPPILDMSAVTRSDFFGPSPAQDDPTWYPTGDFFCSEKKADVVMPYSNEGAVCLNCHASAEHFSTFSSLENVLSQGIRYRHFALPPTPDEGGHDDPHSAVNATCGFQDWPFAKSLMSAHPQFSGYFGTLGPTEFNDVLPLRLPAETYDHIVPPAHSDGKVRWITSDQCISCHDASTSNDSIPNMSIPDPQDATNKTTVNVSPYAEWRASPMGLAGRDPIFFSQVQSETNNLPALTDCIENTCLHCHGVMGQRQFAAENPAPSGTDDCKSLFAITPSPDVPFGTPFRLSHVTDFQDSPQNPAKYGSLARDGISCMVCHGMKSTNLGTPASFTGNFSTDESNLFGPYSDIILGPMANGIGRFPGFGAHIQSSDVCATCHNILLPVFNIDGTKHQFVGPSGTTLSAKYEQTTNFEWQNSDFSKPGTFKSCQDCHMPKDYKGTTLEAIKIANIESSDFAPTTGRADDAELTLAPRGVFSRHSLHGLNLFLNEIFQQQPLLLGIRQIDFMLKNNVKPALLTASDSMIEMATGQTATIEILESSVIAAKLHAKIRVTNKAGHYLPTGVGFRRMFIEFIAADAAGNPIRASGRANALGVILKGVTETPLDTEQSFLTNDQFEKHHEVITSGDQAQIYQEVNETDTGLITTWFLQRVTTVKDNRIRPKGFDPAVFHDDPSDYVKLLAELEGVDGDAHYSDPTLTGSDEITYDFDLTPGEASQIARITVRLFNQSIPPPYLQERFRDANNGPAEKNQIQRLYYLTSHLNTGVGSAISDWKLQIASDCRASNGSPCAAP